MPRKKIKHLREKRERGKRELFELSPGEILGLMKEEDRPILLKEMIHRLKLHKRQRATVKELLRDLIDSGKVVRIRGNRYGLPSKMNLVVGRVRCHPDGYGFVVPEKEGEEDVFISPRHLKEALHGDRVVARVESIRKKGKEGTVIRILERG